MTKLRDELLVHYIFVQSYMETKKGFLSRSKTQKEKDLLSSPKLAIYSLPNFLFSHFNNISG